MVPFERALPYIVTFPLSLVFTRFRDIAAFVLQAPARHFFPPHLYVSPKFPHVSLGVDGWPLGYE